MSELLSSLESFCRIDGVKGAIITDADGKFIEKTSMDEVEFNALENLIKKSIKIGLDASAKFKKDALNQSYLEFEDQSLTSIMLANGCVLSVFTTSGVNLGRIRLEIKKNKKIIESLMG